MRRPGDWPGATSVHSLLTGDPISGPWVDRTTEYELRRRGHPFDARTIRSQESFELAALLCWRGLDSASHRSRVADLIRAVEQETAARLAEAERELVGAERLARQNPHDAPNRMKNAPAPLLHAASRSVRQAFREAYRQFAKAFRRASALHRSPTGIRDRFGLFPTGSFPPPGPFLPA